MVKDCFSDQGLTTENTNPVIADANGRFSNIWLDSSKTYKVVLKDKNGVQQWEADPVTSANNFAALNYTAGFTSAVTRTLQDRLEDQMSVNDFSTLAAAFAAAVDRDENVLYVPGLEAFR